MRQETVNSPMHRVKVLPWVGIEGAYLCVSGKKRRQERVGERWYPKNAEHDEREKTYDDTDFRSEPYISFLYDAGNCCAEWDGAYGPIQLWWKAPENWQPSDESYSQAKPHWFYDFAYGAGHWAQSAVDEAGLPQAFNEGNYGRIFDELRSWAESRNDEYAPFKAEDAA